MSTPTTCRTRNTPKPTSRMKAAARSRKRSRHCVSLVRCGPLPTTISHFALAGCGATVASSKLPSAGFSRLFMAQRSLRHQVEPAVAGSTRPPPFSYNSSMLPSASVAIETVYRSDWGRIVATLIRLIGDFDLAEESAQEAFAAAVHEWPASGVPRLPAPGSSRPPGTRPSTASAAGTLFEEKIKTLCRGRADPGRRGAGSRYRAKSPMIACG